MAVTVVVHSGLISTRVVNDVIVANTEWRANISKATKVAMRRPEVRARVLCTEGRQKLPPKEVNTRSCFCSIGGDPC